MFERYTEKARRVIFFARYEASQYGSPTIETEHMLLGLLREDKTLSHRFLPKVPAESIRQQIEAATTKGEYIATSVDLPLSDENRRVLEHAAEEADRLSQKYIGTEHLLLGLLREEQCFGARLLQEHGVRLSAVREQLANEPREPAVAAPGAEASLARLTVNLTQQAAQGQLRPFVGREKELERLIHILGRSTKKNAVLVGEPGVGKRAIVEGLAQHIAEGSGPSFLAHKAIVELDIVAMARRPQPGVHLAGNNTIFFMDEFHSLLAGQTAADESGAREILKTALLGGKVQCICSATPDDYRKAREKHRWLDRCFRAVEIQPMSEAETIAVLLSVEDRLERFHSRSYTDDAIRQAAHYARVYVKNRYLPDSALDLMDEAAAYANARSTHWPQEVVELRQRIQAIIRNMENTIANHEFEKARSFSDEERKERANLRALLKKHHLAEPGSSQVTREDVEEVLSRWTGIPVSTIRQAGSKAGPEAPEK